MNASQINRRKGAKARNDESIIDGAAVLLAKADTELLATAVWFWTLLYTK